MPTFRSLSRCVIAGAVLASLSCGDATAPALSPSLRNPLDARFLTAAPDAPPLSNTHASFYAVKGRNAGVDMWYQARPGTSDSTKFLEFRLGGASLDRRPDGTTIAEGDSVLITVDVIDPGHFIIAFQPSGLTFSAIDAPRLKMFFGASGPDLNRDGRVDSEDDALEQQLSVWRQEVANEPWIKVASAVVKEMKVVEAQLAGFTGYALMY